jgi:hypothetical protein
MPSSVQVAFAPCPRCSKVIRFFIGTSGGGIVYRCAGCEWLFTMSTQAPTGTGTAAVNTTSSTAITVASGGAAFTVGMALLYDTGTNAEVLTVRAGGSGTSVPVGGFSKAHGTGIAFGQILVTPVFNAIESVPGPAPWGF